MTWPFGNLRMFGYDFAMIDCPWHFETRSEKGERKSPQAQYGTMSLAEIAALPVGQLLKAGGLVWAWYTWPLLDVAPAIFTGQWVDRSTRVYAGRSSDDQFARAGWNLKVVTGGVWIKRTPRGRVRIGTGYVARSACEPFALLSMGEHSILDDPLPRNLIEGIAREHSRKPEIAYRLVERLAPRGFYADVFSRTDRPGWDCFGDEAGKWESQDGMDAGDEGGGGGEGARALV